MDVLLLFLLVTVATVSGLVVIIAIDAMSDQD